MWGLSTAREADKKKTEAFERRDEELVLINILIKFDGEPKWMRMEEI